MHRASVSASLTHRRMPSLESTGSEESPAEKPAWDQGRSAPHAASFPPPPTPARAPELILAPLPEPGPFANKGKDFWLVFLALCVSSFLAAIDLTGVSTVLPTSECPTARWGP